MSERRRRLDAVGITATLLAFRDRRTAIALEKQSETAVKDM